MDATYLHSKMVKTRKVHRCFGCQRDIPAKAEMKASTYVQDGRIYTLHVCKVCEAVFAEWDSWEQQEGYLEGDLRSGDPELWEVKRMEIEDAPGGRVEGKEEV